MRIAKAILASVLGLSFLVGVASAPGCGNGNASNDPYYDRSGNDVIERDPGRSDWYASDCYWGCDDESR